MLHWLYGTNILKITSIHSFIYGVCLCRSHDNLCEPVLFVNHVGLCLYLLSHLAFVYVCICVYTEMFVPCACGGQQNTMSVILQESSMLLLLLFKTGCSLTWNLLRSLAWWPVSLRDTHVLFSAGV